MPEYFFPLLFLTPGFDGDAIQCDRFTIARRKWETTTFDFATLQAHHDLHLRWQVMEVMLSRCNLELRIEGCEGRDDAARTFRALRLGMYVAGSSPFLCPVVASHSINDYSGINSRDSKYLRDNLPQGLRDGLTSETGKVSAWPVELAFQCVALPDRFAVTAQLLKDACNTATRWLAVVAKAKALEVAEDVAHAAPTLAHRDQSLLHIWTAVEALFPNVSQEVSFRLAIYLAQLIAFRGDRLHMYRRVKDAYNVRSKIAHGTKRDIDLAQWQEGWDILMNAIRAIVERGAMPSEEQLLAELFTTPGVNSDAKAPTHT